MTYRNVTRPLEPQHYFDDTLVGPSEINEALLDDSIPWHLVARSGVIVFLGRTRDDSELTGYQWHQTIDQPETGTRYRLRAVYGEGHRDVEFTLYNPDEVAELSITSSHISAETLTGLYEWHGGMLTALYSVASTLNGGPASAKVPQVLDAIGELEQALGRTSADDIGDQIDLAMYIQDLREALYKIYDPVLPKFEQQIDECLDAIACQ